MNSGKMAVTKLIFITIIPFKSYIFFPSNYQNVMINRSNPSLSHTWGFGLPKQMIKNRISTK